MRKYLVLTVFLSIANFTYNQAVVKLRLPANCNNTATSEKSIAVDKVGLIEILPNPSTGIFVLHTNFKESIGMSSIKIYNDYGQLNYVEKLFCDSKELVKKMDLSHLSKGLYVLELHTGNEVKTIKLILK